MIVSLITFAAPSVSALLALLKGDAARSQGGRVCALDHHKPHRLEQGV
jgi:hypothetical protein